MSRIWNYTPLYESDLKEAQRELDNEIKSLNEAMSTVYAYESIIESTSNLEVIKEAKEKAGRTLKDRIKGLLEKARNLFDRFINWIKEKLKITKKKKTT